MDVSAILRSDCLELPHRPIILYMLCYFSCAHLVSISLDTIVSSKITTPSNVMFSHVVTIGFHFALSDLLRMTCDQSLDQ